VVVELTTDADPIGQQATIHRCGAKSWAQLLCSLGPVSFLSPGRPARSLSILGESIVNRADEMMVTSHRRGHFIP
jgi:hypothetical protein